MSEWHPGLRDLEILGMEGRADVKMELALHLLNCPECWRGASDFLVRLQDQLLAKGGRSARITGPTREPAVSCLLEKLKMEQATLEARLVAAAGVANIRRANRKMRRDVIVKDRGKHHTGFVKGLLSESRATSSPYEGEEWAGLALIASQQIPLGSITEDLRSDLLAECYAELASARRRSARWNAAREALRQGNEQARKGTGNGFVQGMLYAVEGLVEGDCGGFEKAEELLSLAVEAFKSVGAQGYAAKAKIQIAYIYLDVDPERSLQILTKAERMIPATDKRLLMFSESIRVDALITHGLIREAMLRFDALTELYDQFGDAFVQLRRRFTAARLLEALGRFAEADSLFEEVVATDLEQRSNKSYFLDQIYMVGSFTRRGDIQRAIAVCHQAIEALASLGLDPESDGQMRKLWTSIAAKLQRDKMTIAVLTAARQFVKTQWRAVGGDALLVKESAV